MYSRSYVREGGGGWPEEARGGGGVDLFLWPVEYYQ